MIRSGTFSSFVIRFFALRAKKRIIDEKRSTMLPALLSLSKGRQTTLESATA